MNALNDWVFSFGCNRWFLYDWQNDADFKFIGERDGEYNKGRGMLRHVRQTNDNHCAVNDSFIPPYMQSRKVVIPYFENAHFSINEEIFSRYEYFNNMSLKHIRETSAVDKMPDGAVYFYEANSERLKTNVKINDERSL